MYSRYCVISGPDCTWIVWMLGSFCKLYMTVFKRKALHSAGSSSNGSQSADWMGFSVIFMCLCISQFVQSYVCLFRFFMSSFEAPSI